MSGYKLAIGFIAIITMAILWIPLNEGMNIVGDTFNSISSDPDVITRNNMAMSIFYFSLFILILAVAIWILKSTIPRKPQVYGYE